jgi:hypothetical protein
MERLVRTSSGENDALRDDLVARGLKWIQEFDWKKSASETIACVESLKL